MPENRRPRGAYRVALPGLLLALALALSFFESLLPALPFLPVGVKLGLANIVTMYCLFLLGARQAFCIAVLRAAFVLLLRGPVGALLSLAGGLLSVAVMLAGHRLLRLSHLLVSILGAVAHNIGQLMMAALLLRSAYAFYYLPVMLLAGLLMGWLTATLLKFVMPFLQHVGKAMK